MDKILVTGCAGFIGSHLTDKLLEQKYDVIGVDNFNDYYDPKIKEKNLENAKKFRNFNLFKEDILNLNKLVEIFKKERPTKIVHLAAVAGIRPSIKNPDLYTQVNVLGTVNLLKLAVNFKIKQFIFGSSSSVYGNSSRLPFSEDDPCTEIISPYGSSKRSAEFFVESFYKSHSLKSVILRFFTVYGPRGRPDMAPAIFTKAILEGEIIRQFGNGLTIRDYTYIDDIINGIMKTLKVNFDLEIINLGNNHQITLIQLIRTLENLTRRKAKIKILPQQTGEVDITWANIEIAKKLLRWQPKTQINVGLNTYIQGYRTLSKSDI